MNLHSVNVLSFKAKVCLYPGKAAWHFVSVPEEETVYIKSAFGYLARGWGSLRVKVTVGGTSWSTSIFPDNKSGTYLLPLKANVRKQEGIAAGSEIEVTLEVET